MKYYSNIFVVIAFFSNLYGFSEKGGGLDLSNQNTSYSPSYIQIQTFSPFTPHSSLLTGENGVSVAYQYPGFYNGITGQVNFYYTTVDKDSYSFGIGLMNLSIGINKKIIEMKDNSIYLNVNYGIHPGNGIDPTFLENSNIIIGLSNLIQTQGKQATIEFAIDGFIHAGQRISFLTPFIPYTRGIVASALLSLRISKALILSFGLGVGSVQYRYDADYAESSSDGYDYIPYTIERKSKEGDYFRIVNPKWDKHIIIPFGLSLSYKF